MSPVRLESRAVSSVTRSSAVHVSVAIEESAKLSDRVGVVVTKYALVCFLGWKQSLVESHTRAGVNPARASRVDEPRFAALHHAEPYKHAGFSAWGELTVLN
eukprot:1241102-Rhodomonas_salina.2